MSALTLTALAENIFLARDTVAREMVGFIPSVLTNTDSNQVSKGGTVDSVVTGQPTLNTSITPSMTIPNGDAQTLGVEQLTLNSELSVRIPVTGENYRKLANIGQYGQAVQDMFAQGIRAMVNKIEQDIGVALKNGASRAFGTAGTTPFASDFKPVAGVRKILADNGAPINDAGNLNIVIDTAAGSNLRSIPALFQANTAGSDDTLRRGTLLDIHGFQIRESGGVAAHTKGTGTGDTLAGTPAIGSTLLTFSAFADGEYVPGDVIAIEDDPNRYVIKSVAHAANQVTIHEPGLRVTGINAKTITVADYTGNSAFHRNAVELAIRPYAMPEGGDASVEVMTIADDKSPLVFDVSVYKGYKTAMFELTAVYGVKVWKPQFVATLLG